MEKPTYGFMHVAAIKKWRDIVVEQLELLQRSGLLASTRSLLVSALGDEPVEEFLSLSNVQLVYRSPDIKEYEFPTLERLQTLCQEQDCRVYYIHTKGVVSQDSCPPVVSWRRYLQHFIIERFQDCLKQLETHDICGVEWLNEPEPHFSGNFWWANSTYIRTLPLVRTLNTKDRQQAEFWIGMKRGVRVACLHQSGINLYHTEYPREAYCRDKNKGIAPSDKLAGKPATAAQNISTSTIGVASVKPYADVQELFVNHHHFGDGLLQLGGLRALKVKDPRRNLFYSGLGPARDWLREIVNRFEWLQWWEDDPKSFSAHVTHLQSRADARTLREAWAK